MKTTVLRTALGATLCLFTYAACSSRTQATNNVGEGGSSGQSSGGTSGGNTGGTESGGASGASGTGESGTGGSSGGSTGSGGDSGGTAGGTSAGGTGQGGAGGVNCGEDADGDGYDSCVDCCDRVDDGCDDPKAVVPGGAEFPDNGFDDDCDGMVDEPTTCDETLGTNPAADGFAQALELCRKPADADPPWGLVSASFSRADGTGLPVDVQRAVRDDFGSITPRAGSRLVILSTGVAAATDDEGFTPYQYGVNHNTASGRPADWLEVNGGLLPGRAACPYYDGSPAYDSVLFRVQVQVPPNARAFAVDVNFLTPDYPEYVCSEYTDFFLALLDSAYTGSPENPSDKNLAFVSGTPYFFNANFAYEDTGLFTACQNGTTGCPSTTTAGTYSSCISTAGLAGTGFEAEATVCGNQNLVGGGTGWRRLRGNVVPGETVTLRFVLWDQGDGTYDSVVLLDNFQWLPNHVTAGGL